MPKISDKKATNAGIDHISNVPEGYCWEVVEANPRVNDVEVTLKDDDGDLHRANVGRFSKVYDAVVEAVENGEVFYLGGGWDTEWKILFD